MKVISNAMVDVTAKEAPAYTKFQFERLGFFSVDPDTTTDEVNSNISPRILSQTDIILFTHSSLHFGMSRLLLFLKGVYSGGVGE